MCVSVTGDRRGEYIGRECVWWELCKIKDVIRSRCRVWLV